MESTPKICFMTEFPEMNLFMAETNCVVDFTTHARQLFIEIKSAVFRVCNLVELLELTIYLRYEGHHMESAIKTKHTPSHPPSHIRVRVT